MQVLTPLEHAAQEGNGFILPPRDEHDLVENEEIKPRKALEEKSTQVSAVKQELPERLLSKGEATHSKPPHGCYFLEKCLLI